VKLIELDSELEGPILVRCISFYRGLTPFNFVIGGEMFTAQINIDNPTFLAAAKAVALELRIRPASLSLFLGDERLDDKSRLSRAKTYRVELSNWEREFVIELVPGLNPDLRARDWDGKHVRRVLVDLGKVKRVGDLTDYLTEHESIGSIDVVANGFSPFPREKPLALLQKRDVITIRYNPPRAPVRYVFASTLDAAGHQRCPAHDLTSVESVKIHLSALSGKRNLLPGALRMTFGDLELANNNKIMDYGIPAESLIDVTLCPTEKVYVFDPQYHPAEYLFAAPDTVGSLRTLLQFHQFPDSEALVVSNLGTEQEPSQLLKDLRVQELQLTNRFLPLTIQVRDEQMTFNLGYRCTVSRLTAVLARKLGVDEKQIYLTGESQRLVNPDGIVFEIRGPLNCEIVDLPANQDSEPEQAPEPIKPPVGWRDV
jgi:hypothetical protein